jgi:ribonuclease HII
MMQKTGKIFTEKEIALLQSIPTKSVIKGDSKFQSIAAASILAKTHRDAYMEKIHEEYPMYNWKQNKGYPTKEHREAIQKYGITKHHRLTFKMI